MPSDFSTTDDPIVALLRDTGALKISEKKEFRLASGAMSDHYFDLRLLCGDPRGIGAIAMAFYNRIKPDIKSVGGVESGSISIATAVSYLSGRQNPDKPLSSFFVRKKPKEHGRKQLIDGVINSPAVILEDVITSGNSALNAVKAVRDAEYECEHLMCVIFRGSEEQERRIRDVVKLQYLFRSDDILDRIRNSPGA